MKRSSLQAASLSLFDLLVTAKAARGLVCTRTREHKISRDVHDEARDVARRNVKTIRQVVNIPAASGQLRYVHCSYTDTSVRQCVSAEPVSAGMLEALGLTVATRDWQPGTWEAALNGTNGGVPVGLDAMTFPVPSRQGERAVFGMTAASNGIDWHEKKTEIMREIRILSDYLHSHVLRINAITPMRKFSSRRGSSTA